MGVGVIILSRVVKEGLPEFERSGEASHGEITGNVFQAVD